MKCIAIRQFILSLLFLSFFQINGKAATLQNTPAHDSLKVGLAGGQPFVFDADSSSPTGISVDIWKELASQSGWNYRIISYPSVSEAIAAVENQDIDLLVGPISVTSERLTRVNFSQPYYQSSLSILSKAEEGLWSYIAPLFSYKLFIAVAGFLFLLGIVGTLFWVAERKVNPEEFPSKPAKGIGNGMWLAVVTMSTVGYGDLAPKSAFGRILAGTWIVLTIIFATSMIAGIASVLTMWGNVSNVNVIEDLSGKKVAVVSDSPAEEFVKNYSARTYQMKSLDEGIKMLNDGQVEAIVYDRPQLEYYVGRHEDEGYHLATAEYDRQNYGFVFPQSSELVYDVNLQLLKLAEARKSQEIIDGYLKPSGSVENQ